jgi:hypothetical protein
MNTKLGRPRQGESVKRSTSVRISDEDRARVVFEHGSLQKFLDKSIKYFDVLRKKVKEDCYCEELAVRGSAMPCGNCQLHSEVME